MFGEGDVRTSSLTKEPMCKCDNTIHYECTNMAAAREMIESQESQLLVDHVEEDVRPIERPLGLAWEGSWVMQMISKTKLTYHDGR